MQSIPEEGLAPASTMQMKAIIMAPTANNLSKLPQKSQKKVTGARSYAQTEKHSIRSIISSLSTMSNFFRANDSPYGGVIPANVLRQAMEKRRLEQEKQGAAQASNVDVQEQPDAMNSS